MSQTHRIVLEPIRITTSTENFRLVFNGQLMIEQTIKVLDTLEAWTKIRSDVYQRTIDNVTLEVEVNRSLSILHLNQTMRGVKTQATEQEIQSAMNEVFDTVYLEQVVNMCQQMGTVTINTHEYNPVHQRTRARIELNITNL